MNQSAMGAHGDYDGSEGKETVKCESQGRQEQHEQKSIVGENSNHIQREIPFLVTHWLANYGAEHVKKQHSNINSAHDHVVATDQERREALARIRRATNEIAAAFATLGAYGTTFRVSFRRR
jgi:hypothetical protein